MKETLMAVANYGTAFTWLFTITIVWGMCERHYRSHGDTPNFWFRVFCACFFLDAVIVIAWPIPNELWLVERQSIIRIFKIIGIAAIGLMISMDEKTGSHESEHLGLPEKE